MKLSLNWIIVEITEAPKIVCNIINLIILHLASCDRIFLLGEILHDSLGVIYKWRKINLWIIWNVLIKVIYDYVMMGVYMMVIIIVLSPDKHNVCFIIINFHHLPAYIWWLIFISLVFSINFKFSLILRALPDSACLKYRYQFNVTKHFS